MAQPNLRSWIEAAVGLKLVEKEASRRVNAAIRQSMGPMVATAKAKAAGIGSTTDKIGPKTARFGAFLTQRERKTTGKHPEFGGMVLNQALGPAVELHGGEVYAEIEERLDRLIVEAGFALTRL